MIELVYKNIEIVIDKINLELEFLGIEFDI